ncbi:Uncharacterised protein [uncultured archaeon]|nr:Uncharacterised protein [uncultured archaeon]
MNTITPEKLEHYFDITGRALKKAKKAKPEADVILDMANRYYEDAKHFKDKGDIVTAFAALNYAHGWLDAGARLGILDVEHDSELFTVD